MRRFIAKVIKLYYLENSGLYGLVEHVRILRAFYVSNTRQYRAYKRLFSKGYNYILSAVYRLVEAVRAYYKGVGNAERIKTQFYTRILRSMRTAARCQGYYIHWRGCRSDNISRMSAVKITN